MSFDLITSFEDLESYLVDQTVKSLPAMRETRVQSLGWEDPLEKEWQPTPVFLPGEFHGQRSLGTVCGVTQSWTRLSDLTLSLHFEDLSSRKDSENEREEKTSQICNDREW